MRNIFIAIATIAIFALAANDAQAQRYSSYGYGGGRSSFSRGFGGSNFYGGGRSFSSGRGFSNSGFGRSSFGRSYSGRSFSPYSSYYRGYGGSSRFRGYGY